MKKLHIICFLLSAFCLFPNALLAQRNKEIKGNGKLITKSIPISNFSKIEIETCVVVDFSQGKNTGSLEFIVDNNLLEYYDIYTKKDVLHIELKEEYKSKRFWLNPTKCLITVSSEQLENIEIAGGSKVNFCTDFTSKKLDIGLAGSAKIFANKYPVNIENCKVSIAGSGSTRLMGDIHLARVDIAGSGSAQFEGTIQQANISIAGSGKVKALDCEIKQLRADVAGSGNVEAHVTDTLTASVAGSGRVQFKGNPDIINSSVAGSGKVRKL